MWKRAFGVVGCVGGLASLGINYSFAESSTRNAIVAKQEGVASNKKNARLIFLGTGSSSGTPALFCTLEGKKDEPRCEVARLALAFDPHLSKNYRNNPSLLIHTPSNEYVVIDVGKTFRESVIRWFPLRNVTSLDAIILTHDHADAVLGLDDVRSVQQHPVPVFLSHATKQALRDRFPYLLGVNFGTIKRHVAMLDWNVFADFTPFETCGVSFTPLPVMHGEDYISHGFSFPSQPELTNTNTTITTTTDSNSFLKDHIVYISDVSRIPDHTLSYLTSPSHTRPSVLVLDSLLFTLSHETHFSVLDALSAVEVIQPKRAVLVGMSGHKDMNHDMLNAFLKKWSEEKGLCVELAYDGMVIDVNL